MGVPSTGTRSDFQCYSLREIERLYKGRVELVYPPVCIHRIFHDAARCGVAEEFLNSDCDVLWFLDSDIAPPVDIMDLILDNEWDLAGLPYPIFMTPPGHDRQQVIVTVYEHDGTGLKAAKVPNAGLKYVDGLATGCLFIRRAVLEQMQRPFFEFKYDPITRELKEGEDLGFCVKVNELGYKFLTDFSKVCAHYKNVNLLEVMNYATQYAQTSIDRFDAEVRPIITQMANEIDSLKKKKTSSIQIAKPGDVLSYKPHVPGLKI